MNFVSRCLVLALLFVGPLANAAGAGGHGRFGLNVGAGLPLLAQGGLNFYVSDNVAIDLDYGSISLDSGLASVSLTVPDVMVKWHPFQGSFFLAAGAGQSIIDSKASDPSSGQSAEIKTTAIAAIGKLGWMWGSVDGGLWFGIDLAYIAPFSPKVDITSSAPTTDQAYQDAKSAADKYSTMGFFNLTFARIGYLF